MPVFEKRLVHVLRLQTLEMIAFLFDSVQIHVPSPQTSPLDYRSSVKRDWWGSHVQGHLSIRFKVIVGVKDTVGSWARPQFLDFSFFTIVQRKDSWADILPAKGPTINHFYSPHFSFFICQVDSVTFCIQYTQLYEGPVKMGRQSVDILFHIHTRENVDAALREGRLTERKGKV